MGLHDIESQVTGFGSPGASALFGVQQEMMRRAALAEQARATALAEARQQQLDELHRQEVEQSIAASKANVAQNDEVRQSMADQRTATATKLQQDALLKTLKPGAVTADVRDKAAKLGLGHLFLATAKPAVPEVVPGSDYEGQPGQAAVPASEDIQFQGTPEQQDTEAHKKMAQEVLNGMHDTGNDALDQFNKARALEFLQTGKETGSGPQAGLIVPKTASETAAARKIAMEDLQARIDQGYQPTADESAKLATWKKYNPTTADVEAVRANAAAAAASRSDARQSETQTFAMKQKLRSDLTTAETALKKDIERSNRALNILNKPGFAADAVAAPEFLQIVAGGMGSGLRMTDAELRRVNEAQTHFEQFKAEAAKWGIGERKTVQEKLRKEMEVILRDVSNARHRHAAELAETRKKLDSVKTPAEVDQLHSDWFLKSLEDSGDAAPVSTGAKRYNPATGKVE